MRHLNYTLATLPVMKSNFCKIHETEKKNRSFDFVFFQAWSFQNNTYNSTINIMSKLTRRGTLKEEEKASAPRAETATMKHDGRGAKCRNRLERQLKLFLLSLNSG